MTTVKQWYQLIKFLIMQFQIPSFLKDFEVADNKFDVKFKKIQNVRPNMTVVNG